MAPLHILVIDDEPDHRELLALALRLDRPEVAVTCAGTREEFFRALRTGSFDCIIMDYNLPGCRGEELLQLARRADPRCPVIVVSCSSDQQVVIQSMRCGGVDFVPKLDAMQPDHIWERVKLAVEARRRRDRERRKLIRRHQQLKDVAERDPLTGLYNRRRLHELLSDGRRETYDRRGQTAILMADVDHFKSINDRFGHPTGDAVLRAVAKTIRARLGPADEAYRWGGEEFLLFLAAETEVGAHEWAEGLRRAVESLGIRAGGEAVRTTLSIGVVYLESAAVSETSIEQADRALYQAKRRGRNQVFLHDAHAPGDTVAEAPAGRGRHTARA